MININLLQSLSYIGGVKLLLEEGYVEGKCIEKDDESCDKLFLYLFSLYDDEKSLNVNLGGDKYFISRNYKISKIL